MVCPLNPSQRPLTVFDVHTKEFYELFKDMRMISKDINLIHFRWAKRKTNSSVETEVWNLYNRKLQIRSLGVSIYRALNMQLIYAGNWVNFR